MINIVIPMAGAGSRFADAGYTKPKPLIDVCGTAMIERVLDNLKLDNARYILIARDEHVVSEKASFERLQEKYNCEISRVIPCILQLSSPISTFLCNLII